MSYGIRQASRAAKNSTRLSTCSVASGLWCPLRLLAPCRTSNAPQRSGIDCFFCICSHGCWRKLGPCQTSCPTSVTSTKCERRRTSMTFPIAIQRSLEKIHLAEHCLPARAPHHRPIHGGVLQQVKDNGHARGGRGTFHHRAVPSQ